MLAERLQVGDHGVEFGLAGHVGGGAGDLLVGVGVAQAPQRSRVIVVGVCMEPDTIRPSVAIGKEIDLRFVFGYDPAEFHETLQWLASGRVDPAPLITGTVGLDGVAGAFEDLAAADRHAKILIRP